MNNKLNINFIIIPTWLFNWTYRAIICFIWFKLQSIWGNNWFYFFCRFVVHYLCSIWYFLLFVCYFLLFFIGHAFACAVRTKLRIWFKPKKRGTSFVGVCSMGFEGFGIITKFFTPTPFFYRHTEGELPFLYTLVGKVDSRIFLNIP